MTISNPEQSAASAPTDLNGPDTTSFFPEGDSAMTTSNTINPDPPTSSSSPPPTTTTSTPPPPPPQTLTNATNTIQITLTHSALSTSTATAYTRSPTAGATVLFLGTTRSYFRDPSRPVSRLSYSAYPALALRTLQTIAADLVSKHNLEKVYVAHRLGEVAVAEESIIVAVSAAHRGPAWAGAEELLERVKERAEIWKREWFVDGGEVVGRDGEEGTEVGVWRDNRDSDRMGNRKGGEEGVRPG